MQMSQSLRHPILKNKGALLAAAGALAALCGIAAYAAWAARRAEEKYPPRGRFIDVDQVRLHYLEKGEGSPTILLLHGNGAMAADFLGSGLLGALAAHHRVIALDRPGFGYSERPRGMKWDATEQARLIASAIQHLAIQQVVVVGHSAGTQCAMALALHAPHLVHSLVLIGGYYYPSPRPNTLLRNMPGWPVIGDVMRYTTSAIAARLMLGKFIKRMFSPQQVPQRFADQMPRDLMLRPGQLGASGEESMRMNTEAASLSQRYSELSLPITILAGDEDGAINTAQQSAKLHEALPHSKLKIVERAGHMLHYAAPLVVIAEIEEAAKAPSAATKKPENVIGG
ncbi:MAG TPA: alpha/beta hydrolase [Burkholderiales bacterium]|nr:alpha/beta hydrolase [Burkholderiales bacterium]